MNEGAAAFRERAADLVRAAVTASNEDEQRRLLDMAGYWQAKALRTEANLPDVFMRRAVAAQIAG